MDSSKDRRDRPWSVSVAVALLLIFEAVYVAVGLYALLYGSWEDLAAIATIFGLTLGIVGLVYFALTVPVLFGRRIARLVLAVLTVPMAALGVRSALLLFAYPPDFASNSESHYAGYFILVNIGPPLSTLFPLLAVVLLYLPPSRTFFGRPPVRA